MQVQLLPAAPTNHCQVVSKQSRFGIGIKPFGVGLPRHSSERRRVRVQPWQPAFALWASARQANLWKAGRYKLAPKAFGAGCTCLENRTGIGGARALLAPSATLT